MNLPSYLERIGYSGDPAPTLETLQAMHRAHFYSVPFENLDIGRGVRIEVDEQVIFDKIVRRQRGGFCLELNGLFAVALRALGFSVDVIGARVMSDGTLSRPMSHMVLIVHLDEPWIADVGFGGRVAEPLRLNERDEQVFGARRYVVANDGDHWFVTCSEPGGPTIRGRASDSVMAATRSYLFTMQPRAFEEFQSACDWLQTSPDSRFTQGDVVSLATPSGRLTLAERRFIVIQDENREEHEVASGDEESRILRDRFGIKLPKLGHGTTGSQ
jgi:N-hydroxyarylamine O-acetyltransferase